jgi:hypothetical protein
MVTIPVTMCMANIARYTEVALAKGFYMTKVVKYNDLVEFYGATKKAQKSMTSGTLSSLPTESKVPIFKVPAFSGDTLKGDVYEREIFSVFGNNSMASFLTSRTHCNNHPAWSGAFASRLRDSLSHSSVLEYLATELEDENNCAKCWHKIKLKFSTSDVKIARMSQDWQELFSLRCETMDIFLTFYSSSKRILYKLKKSKSIAA